MLDRSPQANLFSPGEAGQPADNGVEAPQAAPSDFSPRDFDTPPAVRRTRRSAPSLVGHLAAARAAIGPALAGRRLHAPRRVRLLAPAAILLVLLLLNPAGCGRGSTTGVVTGTGTGHQSPSRTVTRVVTRTVTVVQPAPAPLRSARTPHRAQGHNSPARPAAAAHRTHAEPTVAVATVPETAAAVVPAPPSSSFTYSPPDESREATGVEFGFER